MPDARKKPIAILTNDVPYAIVWALNKYSRVEAYSSKRKIVIANGREFYICNRPEDLMALEIDFFEKAFNPSVTSAKNFERDLIQLAKTRIR